MTRIVDPAEPARIMTSAGYLPLVPYPGSAVPWPCIHERCGGRVAPLYANVRRRGGGCRICGAAARVSTRRARHADRAEAVMLVAGFEPLEPYPGADKPWRCMHQECGEERTPTLNTVRANGAACRPCSLAAIGKTTWTEARARELFRSHELTPLDPWPNSSSAPWKARHEVCGRVVSPRVGNVAAGQGPCRDCGQEAAHATQRLKHDYASIVMRNAQLEPLEPFPGADRPWRCRHACGREVRPTYSNVKRGQGGCVRCGAQANAERFRMSETAARAILAAHQLDPIEAYQGSNRPWKSRHCCGRIVSPTLSNVASGRGVCRYCNSAFPYDGPAIVYLITDRDAVKIGCANRSGRRLDHHRRLGWEIAWTLETPTVTMRTTWSRLSSAGGGTISACRLRTRPSACRRRVTPKLPLGRTYTRSMCLPK